MLPDIDAISLWSRFDQTIGSFLHLSHTGRNIYFSNYWYSHHNFTHSLVGGLLITSCLVLLPSLPVLVYPKSNDTRASFRGLAVYWLAAFAGYVMHLVGDLPTPSHTWGGIKLFWPLPQAIGGTGHIWWWNNYDIFLILAGCCTVNLGLIVFAHFVKKPLIRYLPLVICMVSLLAIFYQIDQRHVDFAQAGHAAHEKKSLEIQQQILGRKLYGIMREIDRKLPLCF